jgi:hypothetical protein
MVTVGLLATLNAKSGKEDDLASFLNSALPLAQAEDDTIAWFAIKIDSATCGIFDVFPGPNMSTNGGEREESANPQPLT